MNNTKKKALLIFADLDGTFCPFTGKQLGEFASKVKEIQDLENVQVKFIIVSGRNTGHTRGLMQVVDYNLKEEGVNVPVDFSFSEQGGVIIATNSQVEHKYIGKKDEIKFKNALAKAFDESKFSKYFSQCPLNEFNSAFVFSSKAAAKLSNEEKTTIRKEFVQFLEEKFGNIMSISDSGAIEVTPPSINKERAIEYSLAKYKKDFNIAGLIYCGDSGNDLPAINYVSKLAMCSGIKSYVFTPSNAKEIVSSEKLEKWKDKLQISEKKNIKKASKKTLAGINELLDEIIKEGKFLGTGLDTLKVKDDIELTQSKQKWTDILSKIKLKDIKVEHSREI